MAKSTRVVVLTTQKRRKEGGGGSKKYGRNKVKCARYRAEGRREKNKARKQKRILKIAARKQRRKDRKQ